MNAPERDDFGICADLELFLEAHFQGVDVHGEDTDRNALL
jgi:hypothetical protein